MNGRKTSRCGLALSQIAIVLIVSLGIAPHLIAEQVPGASKSDSVRDQARYYFERGVSFFQTGQYERALESFQQANNLKPNSVVRLNIANCYDRMDRPTEAIFHFERFLADAEISADQRQAVQATIQRLRAKLSDVTIQVTPEGATVQIDVGQRRVAPIIEPVPLIAGKHWIEVSHPDYRSEKREIDVMGGKPMEVSFVLHRNAPAIRPFETPVVRPGPQARLASPKETPAEAAPVSEPTAETEVQAETAPVDENPEPATAQIEELPEVQPHKDSQTNRNTAVIVAGAITAGLAVTAAVLGGLALNADSEYKDLAADWKNTSLSETDRGAAREEANNTANKSKNLALASDVFWASTAAGTAVTLCLLLLWPKPRDTSNASSIVPTINSNNAGIRMFGSF